jgi:uncharacterized protein YecT (DUF1311 family)
MTTTGKTSDDYKPCVAIWPNGQQRRTNVAYIRLDTVDSARQKLADNQVAWVAPDDVEKVLRKES